MESDHNGLQRTAVRQERNHKRDQRDRTMQAIERCALSLTKRLAAHMADIASPFLAVDANVALPALSPCRTVPVRAECVLRVHGIAHLHAIWPSYGLCP